jgi:hypothetical protein
VIKQEIQMSLFIKQLDDVSEEDIQDLVDQKFAEWKTVEYKEALSVSTESDTKKFLSQASSFANAAGGHLIYGVRAIDGVPSEVCGLEIDNPDAMTLRLQEKIRDGIRQRIPGVLIRAVPVKTDRVVIVIRIPKSWALPHQVIFNKEFRFYSRSSNGKYILDVDELRALFTLSETNAERIRNFRAARLSMMVAGETPVVMDENPKIILHIIPLGAFDAGSRYDLASIKNETDLLQPIRASGWNGPRHNFDGIYTVADHKGMAYSYLQVFRNGIIEAVNTSLLDPKYDNRKIIPSVAYEEALRKALTRHLSLEKRLGVEPPFVAMLSLLGVSDYVMAVSPSRHYDESQPIDRDALLVPEVVIESFEADVDRTLQPVFDAVWNAAGWPRSINFDEEGRWAPEQ